MENLLIILLALICTGLPFWMGQAYGIVRLVSPMHLLAYFCAFGFLLKVSVYSFQPDLAFYRRYVDNPWADQLGAIYLTLFILMICLGYRVACRPYCRADSVAAARVVAGGIARRGWLFSIAIGFAVATIAVILRARGAATLDADVLAGLNTAKQININAAGVGATLAGVKTFFIIPKFAFVLLLAYGIVSGRRGAQFQAMLLGGLLVLIALVSGDRFELVELIIFALATYMILGGHIGGRALLFGLIGLVGLVLISGYMTQLRLGAEQGLARSALLRQVVGSTYFLDINAAIMVTDRVETSSLLLGESYGWWSFGWVPRAIWAEKPAIDLGVFFKRDVMHIYTGGAFNVTGPGEAFINFGWFGVAVGFALGWIYRVSEAALLSAFGTIRYGAFLLYPMLFYPFVQATLQSSFSAFIVGAAAQLVLIAAMIMVFVARYSLWISQSHRNRSQLYVA